jgi:hypothetical protein
VRHSTSTLFEQDPVLQVTRGLPYWLCAGISTIFWGYLSTRFKTIREPLFAGYLILTASAVGFATLRPGQSANSLGFSALGGVGFGAPLVLIIAGVQLSTPHHLIATATAVTTSSRAIAASVFTAIYSAALSNGLATKLPEHIASSALAAGLPSASVKSFVKALVDKDTTALSNISGVTPAIIAAGVAGLKEGFADSVRIVWIIAAPFGATACIAALFLGSMRKTMNYRIDAPVEDLHAKQRHNIDEKSA